MPMTEDRIALYEREKVYELRARELCVAAGHDPDAVGYPESDDPTLPSKLPLWRRWMLWRAAAKAEIENQ